MSFRHSPTADDINHPSISRCRGFMHKCNGCKGNKSKKKQHVPTYNCTRCHRLKGKKINRKSEYIVRPEYLPLTEVGCIFAGSRSSINNHCAKLHRGQSQPKDLHAPSNPHSSLRTNNNNITKGHTKKVSFNHQIEYKNTYHYLSNCSECPPLKSAAYKSPKNHRSHPISQLELENKVQCENRSQTATKISETMEMYQNEYGLYEDEPEKLQQLQSNTIHNLTATFGMFFYELSKYLKTLVIYRWY